MATPLLKHPYARVTALAATCLIFFYFVPLIHFAPLSDIQNQAAEAKFDAKGFVDEFWQQKLLPASGDAMEASALLQALKADPRQAAESHGKQLGLSSTSFYFVQGAGTVVSKNDDRVVLSLADSDNEDIVIEMGPVFSNAVRDGTGLLDIAQFSNTREYNEISSEINLRVEQQLFPRLSAADITPGTQLHFAGGIELADSDLAPKNLKLIPVLIELL